MNKNIDYFESQDEQETEKILNSALELAEMIDQKVDNEPPRGGKLHREWKKEVNEMMDLYNTSYGKVYTHVK